MDRRSGGVTSRYTDEAVESMFGAFLSSLDRGIYVNGDYVPIEVEGADWVDKDDSILKAQVAVQIRIRFDGGLYIGTHKRSPPAGVSF